MKRLDRDESDVEQCMLFRMTVAIQLWDEDCWGVIHNWCRRAAREGIETMPTITFTDHDVVMEAPL